MEPLYDFTKISKEDFKYYMKFINYYSQEIGLENIYLKGVHSPILKGLDLLKSCDYDINKALSKILFPVMDRMKCLESSNKNKMYLTCALHELIGADKNEKKKFLDYLFLRLENKIDLKDLEILIEAGMKMKIEIPSIVKKEIENSYKFSKILKQYLSNKNNELSTITNLYEISKTFKVQTDQFSKCGELIKKAENLKLKVKEIYNTTVQYKTLQTLYNELKNLPFKFEGEKFENLKKRFESAQEWQHIYNSLPKHSKTRQNNNSNNHGERSSLQTLKKMIETAHVINFRSNEVEILERNYKSLCEEEKKIKNCLNDKNVVKSKELLQEFIDTLDSLRFTTELYEVIETKINFLEWKEKKENYCLNNKVVKNKNLLNLIKFSETKNLKNFEEIKEFTNDYNIMKNWVKKLENIFDVKTEDENKKKYNGNNNNIINLKDDNSQNSNEDLISIQISNNNNNNNKNKINNNNNNNKINFTYEEIISLYNTGKNFKYISEEGEYLLNKIDEIKALHDEIKSIMENKENPNFNKINSLCNDINEFSNIKCKEFDFILNQICDIENWIKSAKNFLENFENLKNNKIVLNNINFDFETRQKNIIIIDKFMEENNLFLENLNEIINNVPIFAKNSIEYKNLLKLIENEDENENLNKNFNLSNINCDNKFNENDLTELINLLNSLLNKCISKSKLENLFNIYKIQSWKFIVNVSSTILNGKKLSLTDAESLLKDSKNLNIINLEEVKILKDNIKKVKEWIKDKKDILNSNKISYNNLINLYKKGKNLPLKTQEFNSFENFINNENNKIDEIKNLISENINNNISFPNFDEIDKLNFNINKKINVPEYNILDKMYLFSYEWNEIANKIINSRPLCQLYFKKKSNYNNINNNITLNEEENNNNKNNEINNKKDIINSNVNFFNNNIIIHKEENLLENNSSFLNKKRKSSSESNESLTENLSPLEKYNLSIPLSSSECENLLSLINNTTNILNNNNNSNQNNNFNINNNLSLINQQKSQNLKTEKQFFKKFQKFSYNERYNFLNERLVLKEDNGEQYCICRKGDDSVNYMIMCECCKEWFHGKCLKLNKNIADNLNNFYCLSCTLRKDLLQINTYHNEFYNEKRISDTKLDKFIKDGEKFNFWQMDILKNIQSKVIEWKEKYKKLIKNLYVFFYENKNDFLNNEYEKEINILFLESEGLCCEINLSFKLILLLKISDWFKEIIRLLKNKKCSEKEKKKIINSSYYIFNGNYLLEKNEFEEENKLFMFLYEKGANLIFNFSCINGININDKKDKKIGNNNNNKKKKFEENFDYLFNLLPENMNENEKNNLLNTYFEWKQMLKTNLLNNDFEKIENTMNKVKQFPFDTETIIIVKNILNNGIENNNIKFYLQKIFGEK